MEDIKTERPKDISQGVSSYEYEQEQYGLPIGQKDDVQLMEKLSALAVEHPQRRGFGAISPVKTRIKDQP